jgi:hypothetical protein
MQRSTHCAFHHSSASSPQFIATSISRALALYEREAASCGLPVHLSNHRDRVRKPGAEPNEYGHRHRAAFPRQFEGGATFPSIGNDFSVE